MERSVMLTTTQSANWNGLDTCDALLCMSDTLQSALESRQEASTAFDKVNHQGSALWVLEVLCCQ